jgi:uncharacterized membrane protein YcjF (UPF0283 family)
MKPHLPSNPWTRLVVAARQVPDERDSAAPYGFATRVAALAFSSERRVGSAFDRFALRALGVAFLLTVATLASNISVVTDLFAKQDTVSLVTEDPVAELVDAASS